MAVFRVNKNANYTCMSNIHLQDKRLSLRARGLLSIILSLPDNWDYSKRGLLTLINESELILDGALGELKKYGYLEIEKHMPTAGSNRYSYVYNIFEKPCQDPDFQGLEVQGLEVQGLEVQGLENHPLNKVLNQPNTKEINTKKASTKPKEGFQIYSDNEKLREAIKAFAEFRKASKKPMTDHAIELLVVKLEKMAQTDDEKIAILEQSMLNGWTGIYEVKKDGKTYQRTNERTAVYDTMDKSFMRGKVG